MNNRYGAVKENIIKNFLNRNYLWTCVTRKEAVFEDMSQRSPFPFEYNYDNDVLMVRLGNGINISFNFTWEYNNSNRQFHLIKVN